MLTARQSKWRLPLDARMGQRFALSTERGCVGEVTQQPEGAKPNCCGKMGRRVERHGPAVVEMLMTTLGQFP